MTRPRFFVVERGTAGGIKDRQDVSKGGQPRPHACTAVCYTQLGEVEVSYSYLGIFYFISRKEVFEGFFSGLSQNWVAHEVMAAASFYPVEEPLCLLLLLVYLAFIVNFSFGGWRHFSLVKPWEWMRCNKRCCWVHTTELTTGFSLPPCYMYSISKFFLSLFLSLVLRGGGKKNFIYFQSLIQQKMSVCVGNVSKHQTTSTFS